MMKLLQTLILLLLLAPGRGWAADEQISSQRIESLDCRAWNGMGTSLFSAARDGSVTAVTNGFMRQSYALSNAGNSSMYGFSYVNLAASGTRYLSFVFPAQRLNIGTNALTGMLVVNVAVNPFSPVSAFGAAWAQVACTVTVRSR